MACQVREASEKDGAGVVALIAQLTSEMGGSSALTEDYVAGYLRFPGNHVLLAEEDGSILGLISFSVRPGLFHAADCALIEELVVAAGRRGRGVGGMLLNDLLVRLEQQGCAEVAVTTMPGNEGAARFYRSHGLVDEAVYLEKHF